MISGFRCDAVFLDITQRRVVIVYRRFGTTYRSIFKGQVVQQRKVLFFFFSKQLHSDSA
jgi:hypothetical protein